MTTAKVVNLLFTAEREVDELLKDAEGPRREDLHNARSRIALVRHLLVMCEASDQARTL